MPVAPIVWPRDTTSPLRTAATEIHEYVLESPPPWTIVTNSSPPTRPANDTLPASGARIGVPGATAMSIPRCPAPNGVSGGSNPRITGPVTGQDHVPFGGAGANARSSGAGPPAAPGVTDDGPSSTISRGRVNAANVTPVLRSTRSDDPRRGERRGP